MKESFRKERTPEDAIVFFAHGFTNLFARIEN
jgi:hypothetical protein